MIWVTTAKYAGGHRVLVEFNDGRAGIVDLREAILNDPRAIFRPLRNPDYFKRFKVDMDTLVWDNGADFAPEFLYAHLQEAVAV